MVTFFLHQADAKHEEQSASSTKNEGKKNKPTP